MAEDAEITSEALPKATVRFTNLKDEQVLKIHIFDGLASAEYEAEHNVRAAEMWFQWIWNDKVPKLPKDRSHLREVKGEES